MAHVKLTNNTTADVIRSFKGALGRYWFRSFPETSIGSPYEVLLDKY
jgi:predicted phage gp36 major capsid-like protein